jgi:peptidyl-tRNA hydrolase
MRISNIKLIVGLGNPGQQYINTRHNIGYKIIDELGEAYHKSTQELQIIMNKVYNDFINNLINYTDKFEYIENIINYI